ncbi:MAG: hypothetical protein JXR37_22200 [Kiritimatiellae bacterium]|nr:hypothetical protein [Kiritimatiellia bacterium]
MSPQPTLTAELEAVLARYVEIQQEAQRLQDEKTRLREQLAEHMERSGCEFWQPLVRGLPLRVRLRKTVEIEYDEQRLHDVLGERYRLILAPDLRKLRRNLGRVAAQLEPVLDLVGSPAPDRVRAAIKQGRVHADEFAGAFKKTTKRSVAVLRAKQEDAPPGAAREPVGPPATRHLPPDT